MQCCWTGVGVFIPSSLQVCCVHSGSPRSENLRSFVELVWSVSLVCFSKVLVVGIGEIWVGVLAILGLCFLEKSWKFLSSVRVSSSMV